MEDKIKHLEKRLQIIEAEMKQGYQTIKHLEKQIKLLQSTKTKQKRRTAGSHEYFRKMEFVEYLEVAFEKALKGAVNKFGQPSFGLDDVIEKYQKDQDFMENWQKFKEGDNGARPTLYFSQGRGLHHLQSGTAGAFAQKWRKKD